jgi:cytoskeletal protein RodZ
MADQYLPGRVRDERVNRRQVGENRKQPNWFESVVAGAAMLVVGIVGVVAVFDWYFFSVVDGISTTLEPIVSAFHQANVNTPKKPENAPHRVERSATIERLREDFTIPSEEQSSRARSLIVPMRSAANSGSIANSR